MVATGWPLKRWESFRNQSQITFTGVWIQKHRNLRFLSAIRTYLAIVVWLTMLTLGRLDRNKIIGLLAPIAFSYRFGHPISMIIIGKQVLLARKQKNMFYTVIVRRSFLCFWSISGHRVLCSLALHFVVLKYHRSTPYTHDGSK